MNADALAQLRENYQKATLDFSDLPANPLDHFKRWMQQAIESDVPEPNAMTLATADAEGNPSARTVLLKGLDEDGFHFFTNQLSRKGQEIATRPQCALVFLWKELERQVLIRGEVSPLNRDISRQYFQSRPYESQIGAWASIQSEVIPSRAWLEAREAELKAQYPAPPLPLPDYWGGYLVKPREIEFWQGRPGRLHDRLRYNLQDSEWKIERLSP